MSYEQKPNSGSLFKNDEKQSDSHSDYKGSAVIDGTAFWLNAWINETKDGKKYMKLTFKPKEAKPSISEQAVSKIRKPDPISSGKSLREEMNDDIPF